jgi:serine/threonine-protein kinase PRP4
VKQLATALSWLEEENIIHADLKPDNILTNSNGSIVKLADFGSAMRQHEMEVTPYLISRYYRAPEVMIGAK